MSYRTTFVCILALATLLGCVEPPSAVPNTRGDTGASDATDDSGPRDAGSVADARAMMDVGVPSDLGRTDANATMDLGAPVDMSFDAATDVGPVPDSGDMTGMDMMPDMSADMAPDAEVDMMPAPTCTDGVMNGTETDVDCGGPTCPICVVGEMCLENADCETSLCDAGTCAWPASCAQIKRLDPATTDGTYRIDADGIGPAPAVDAYCDMTTDGGVGYTVHRIDDASLVTGTGVQDAYRTACEAVGMEVIVPRTKAHALAITSHNGGEPPNLVNVYPMFQGAVGLNNWEGHCQGSPCRYWLNDTNSSLCGGSEPNGDNLTTESLYRRTGPSADCPLGNWNDSDDNTMNIGGWVLCSTNDAGPPTYGSCLEILNANSLQNTRYAGTSGDYVIQPAGAANPVEVICDMVTDGGGYTYHKVEQPTLTAAVDAEAICDTYGMQLLIPRSADHRYSAFYVATGDLLGTTANSDYMRILGVYPQFLGARCDLRAFQSDNPACEFRAGDDNGFFITFFDGFADPDGTTGDLDDSLLYTWDVDGALNFIDDFPNPGATSYRFICDVGDKH